MIYPTVKIIYKIHAVKDEHSCLCGTVYRQSIPKNNKDLFKPIEFKKIQAINCKSCKKALLENIMT